MAYSFSTKTSRVPRGDMNVLNALWWCLAHSKCDGFACHFVNQLYIYNSISFTILYLSFFFFWCLIICLSSSLQLRLNNKYLFFIMSS